MGAPVAVGAGVFDGDAPLDSVAERVPDRVVVPDGVAAAAARDRVVVPEGVAAAAARERVVVPEGVAAAAARERVPDRVVDPGERVLVDVGEDEAAARERVLLRVSVGDGEAPARDRVADNVLVTVGEAVAVRVVLPVGEAAVRVGVTMPVSVTAAVRVLVAVAVGAERVALRVVVFVRDSVEVAVDVGDGDADTAAQAAFAHANVCDRAAVIETLASNSDDAPSSCSVCVVARCEQTGSPGHTRLVKTTDRSSVGEASVTCQNSLELVLNEW